MGLGASASTSAAGTSRQSFGSWFAYWNDAGGLTEFTPVTNPTFFRRYNPIVQNFEIPGTAAHLDTAAHEGLHAFIGRRLPFITDLGDARLLNIPVGAPVKYAEEVAAYATGHVAAGRLHGLPLVGLEALQSLKAGERVVVIVTGTAASGGYAVYKLNQK